ncbi:MAG: TetR/AcrR family transcriptional regulator [Gammaproteobacteria bacterium]|nr:TetR/AcrR family transcriptional regulator [Gammaproteobacteria bacterium]
MPRPSQNTDQRLIKAARKLLPETGCSGLNLRQVAAKAKVNLGMFHYHFRTKDEFLRQVLQEFYEEFFKNFELQAEHHPTSLENLRAALLTFATFARDNRRLVFVLLRDAMHRDQVVLKFLRANLHRHITILIRLIRECQAQGELAPLAPQNMLVTLVSSMNIPSIISEGVRRTEAWPGKKTLGSILDAHVLSDAALAARIEFLLREMK